MKRFVTLITLTVSLLAITTLTGAAPPATKVDFSGVEKIVERECRALKIADRYALISQSEVQPILAILEKSLWKVPDAERIVADTLPASHMLVQKLRTPRARSFATAVARLPHGFDRLDHVSRLSDGSTIIDRLIDTPDGYKLIDYMATAPGGEELGGMLSAAPGGKNFNQPTGRIYTQKDLLERLEKSFTGASSAAKSKRKTK